MSILCKFIIKPWFSTSALNMLLMWGSKPTIGICRWISILPNYVDVYQRTRLLSHNHVPCTSSTAQGDGGSFRIGNL